MSSTIPDQKIVMRAPKAMTVQCECHLAEGGRCPNFGAGEFELEGWPDSIILCARCEANGHSHDNPPAAAEASYKEYARAPGVPASETYKFEGDPERWLQMVKAATGRAPLGEEINDQLEQTVDDTIRRQGGGWSTFCRLGEWWVERTSGARRVSMSLSTTNADLAGSRFYHLQNEFRDTALDELLLATFALRIGWARERPKTIDVAEVQS